MILVLLFVFAVYLAREPRQTAIDIHPVGYVSRTIPATGDTRPRTAYAQRMNDCINETAGGHAPAVVSFIVTTFFSFWRRQFHPEFGGMPDIDSRPVGFSLGIRHKHEFRSQNMCVLSDMAIYKGNT
ncbi:hypothetical protein LLG95_12940 [bacterium]|nr:hypothetical protein [bacterium]